MPEIGSVPVGQSPIGARPRTVGAILSEAFELYKRNAALLIVTAAVAMGPVFLVKDAIFALALSPVATAGLEADADRMQDLDRQMEEARARGATPAEIQSIAAKQMQVALGSAKRGAGLVAGFFLMLLGLLITIPLMVLAAYLAQAALTVVIADRTREGGSLTWQQAWGVVLRDLIPLAITSVLVALGVALGLVLCIVPGLFFLAFFGLAPFYFLDGRLSLGDAFSASREAVSSKSLAGSILLCIIVGVLGLIACVVGVFVTEPVAYVAVAFLYRYAAGQRVAA